MILKGKKGLIMGVANDKSIATAVAQLCHQYGAELAFSYQGEMLEKRVRPIAESLNSDIILECDVANDLSVDNLFNQLAKQWGGVDFIMHSIAFSNKENLKGRYCNVSRDDFKLAMDVSVYSFTAVMRRAFEIFNQNGSAVTMSYYGAQKIIPNYNIMGVAKAALEASVRYLANDFGPEKNIRVNSISAGPIRTLASSAIGDFKSVLDITENNAPLRRNVTAEDVAKTAVYLFSDLASGVTGENIFVDCGYNQIGLCINNNNE